MPLPRQGPLRPPSARDASASGGVALRRRGTSRAAACIVASSHQQRGHPLGPHTTGRLPGQVVTLERNGAIVVVVVVVVQSNLKLTGVCPAMRTLACDSGVEVTDTSTPQKSACRELSPRRYTHYHHVEDATVKLRSVRSCEHICLEQQACAVSNEGLEESNVQISNCEQRERKT